MKNLIHSLGVILSATILFSCKKDTVEASELASVRVVNMIINAGAVKVNYFGKPIIWANYFGNVNTNNSAAGVISPSTLNYTTYGVYVIPPSDRQITIVPTADTLTPVFNNSLNFKTGDIYSLYLIGQIPVIESILVKEDLGEITKIAIADSAFNVRFINLSPNSPAININLSTTPAVTEFNNLAYKQTTAFKTYPGKVANGSSYIFQVRNATTNALLSSFTLSLSGTTSPRFHSVTLVLRGLVGGSPSFGVTRVNNY